MGDKRTDPRKQFSKWLARSSAWFLIFYLTALLALIYFRPEAAVSCVYLAIIMAVIRIFDAGFYTKNSTTEKLLLTMLDKTRMTLSLKGGNPKAQSEGDEPEEDEEFAEDEGGETDG